MMNLDNYFQTVAREAVEPLRSDRPLHLALNEKAATISEDAVIASANSDQVASIVLPIPGLPVQSTSDIGTHPDFHDLAAGETRAQYIVSFFADIEGSTRLAALQPLDKVRHFKNLIIRAMITTISSFGGHVQRLQGDAVFAYFGRKSKKKSQAIVDALNTAACLKYGIATHVAPYLEQSGLPTVSIRVGIDYGDDEDTLWSEYGLDNCTEITTTSVHTDLACKMQALSLRNGAMIGDNIRKYLDFPDEYYEKPSHLHDSPHADGFAIAVDGFRYRMWNFDIDKYLCRFLYFSHRNNNEKFPFHYGDDFSFTGHYSDGDSLWQPFPSSCLVLPKYKFLKFRVELKSYLANISGLSVRWQVENRGSEATKDESLVFTMKEYKNKLTCYQATAYTGHHYMKVTLHRGDTVLACERYGVYINDD